MLNFVFHFHFNFIHPATILGRTVRQLRQKILNGWERRRGNESQGREQQEKTGRGGQLVVEVNTG